MVSLINVNKSPGDKNLYKAFTLENGVKVLLIQDNNQQEFAQGDAMAYCSIAINVGSFNDPPERQGLAHFLEHMLFMGSTKYPDEADYSDHLQKHGGYCNAYTEFEWTNYQLECNYAGLKQALDMAANNFASPLLA